MERTGGAPGTSPQTRRVRPFAELHVGPQVVGLFPERVCQLQYDP